MTSPQPIAGEHGQTPEPSARELAELMADRDLDAAFDAFFALHGSQEARMRIAMKINARMSGLYNRRAA